MVQLPRAAFCQRRRLQERLLFSSGLPVSEFHKRFGPENPCQENAEQRPLNQSSHVVPKYPQLSNFANQAIFYIDVYYTLFSVKPF
jgi:hypothetical protein